ncbi:MAG: AAA family ATPase [Kofleriaceae bacterium]|nr:AAA family ATPase [Kofleriaceae bacterium]
MSPPRPALAVVRQARRSVAISPTGRFVAMRAENAIEIVDAVGTAPRYTLPADGVGDFACVGGALWLLRGAAIDRYALASGRALAPRIELPSPGSELIGGRGELASVAVVPGMRPVVATAIDERVEVTTLADATAVFPLTGSRVAAMIREELRLVVPGRGDAGSVLDRERGTVAGAWSLFGGRAHAVLWKGADGDRWNVVRTDGVRVHTIDAPSARRWTVAGDRGVAIGFVDGALCCIDLRYGRTVAEARAPFDVADLDIGEDGQYVTLGGIGEGAVPVVHVPYAELFAAEPGPRVAPASTHAIGHAIAPTPTPAIDAAGTAVPVSASPQQPQQSVAALPLPLALGTPLEPLTSEPSPLWPPYRHSREHLEDMLDFVAARTARAIAEAWNSGRLTAPTGGSHPFEREVRALLGHAPGFAPAELSEADERLAAMAARNAGRVRSTLAAGMRLPFIELMRELDLSPTAGHALMVALAPCVSGEIGRLFGILGNDPARPLVDRHLIELVLAGNDRGRRAEIAIELAEGAPLLRHGVLHVSGDPGQPLFQAVSVDAIVLARVRGELRTAVEATRGIDELAIAPDALRALAVALSRPRPASDPLRLVIRGRRGTGRRSVIAALAARVGRTVKVIDCTRMPRASAALASALQCALRQAVLHGAVPLISGLAVDSVDAEGQDRLREVLRAHPGPLVIRAASETTLPLDPGHVTVELPSLSETARAELWRDALQRAGLPCSNVDALAARWRIGPGVIEQVIAQVVAQRDVAADDIADALDIVARQHVATRLEHIATPQRRLARWEDVALPEDAIDSIRDFIARIAHRRTVYEQWGFESKIASARGLTALFYGPPGTGKSMVAGLIARELGLELYRIDLARIVSKWIGETEKHLAEVFDAAEEGQVVLLFDEADSLFAKRTEVKTSVDRYANLEVNYLLQRLDSFEGVAILTTNLEGSIDQAFKRRLSLRLHFPFPDEDIRKRLWAQHIPLEVPTAGDIDFADLAIRFPLSGGYIRNSALRAAFLAAQEQRPLAHDHLERAIALQYRELGKLSTDGRIE